MTASLTSLRSHDSSYRTPAKRPIVPASRRRAIPRSARVDAQSPLRSSRLRRVWFIDDFASDHGEDDIGLLNRARLDLEDIAVEHNQVRNLADNDGAFGLLAVTGKRGAKSIRFDGLPHGKPLLRIKSTRRFAGIGLPRHSGLNAGKRIQRSDGPIAAKDVAAASVADAIPGPGAGGAIGTDCRHPDLEGLVVRVGVQRLHAGDDREFSETPNVLRRDRLDVFDAMAAVFAVILMRGFLVGVEGGADGKIADGVGVDLNIAFVECGDGRLVLRDVPEEGALGRGIVRVGFDHRGGVSFNHAVKLELRRTASLEPVVAEFFVSGFESVEVFGAELIFGEAIGHLETNCELPFLADLG